jgi:hypothetical protein
MTHNLAFRNVHESLIQGCIKNVHYDGIISANIFILQQNNKNLLLGTQLVYFFLAFIYKLSFISIILNVHTIHIDFHVYLRKLINTFLYICLCS